MDEKLIERLDNIELLTEAMTNFMDFLGNLLTPNNLAAE
jgi:hypothetical protein